MRVELPPETAAGIARHLASGHYATPGDVIVAALAMLAEVAYLRQAWEEGIASGDGGEFDPAEIKREAREASGRG